MLRKTWEEAGSRVGLVEVGGGAWGAGGRSSTVLARILVASGLSSRVRGWLDSATWTSCNFRAKSSGANGLGVLLGRVRVRGRPKCCVEAERAASCELDMSE